MHWAFAADVPIATQAQATLGIPGAPDFLAVDRDQVWVLNTGRVERLSSRSRAPTATVTLTEPCGAMVVAYGSLWVADCHDKAVVRIDRQTLAVTARIATGLADPEGELSLAAGAGSVWVLSDATGVLTRIDARSNSIVARIPVAAHSFAAAFGFDSVWITTTEAAGQVQRIDPAGNRVAATIAVGPLPRFLAAGAGGVWTLNQGDGSVSRIDPRHDRLVASIEAGVPGSGGDIDAGAGRVWVRATRILLAEIDPATNRIVRTYGPPAGSGAVRVAAREVWVTAHDIQTVWALRTRQQGLVRTP